MLKQIRHEHKYDTCLFLDLKGTLVQPVEQSQSHETEYIDLYLTLNFNEQRVSLENGSFKFGLNGGELWLWLRNGVVPYPRGLTRPLETGIEKEVSEEEGNEDQSSLEVSLPTGLKANDSIKEIAKRTKKTKFNSSQVSTAGPPEKPAWIFKKAKTDELVLIGTLDNAKLGTLNVDRKAKPCRVKAIFNVIKKNLEITDLEGERFERLSPDERRAIKLGIIKNLAQEVKPYMSLVELLYD